MMCPLMRLARAHGLIFGACALATAAGSPGCSPTREANDGVPAEVTCAEREVGPLIGREGRCISGGNLYVVAARGKPVRVADGTVTLTGVDVERLRRGRSRVVIGLRVANRRSRPLDWRRRVVARIALITDERRYFGKITGDAAQGGPIEPGASARTWVAFDLPPEAAMNLDQARSALFFAADTKTRYAGTTIGVIRLSG
jgi:hypothetical protein